MIDLATLKANPQVVEDLDWPYDFDLNRAEEDAWVGLHFDDPEKYQHLFWIDQDGTLERYGKDGELAQRIYLD